MLFLIASIFHGALFHGALISGAHASEPMIDARPYSSGSETVFLLKKSGPTPSMAFVRTSETEKAKDMIQNQGYELVVKNNADGSQEAVIGQTVPQEVIEAEAEEDNIDLGLGLNIGITTGLKGRLLFTTESGMILGVDIDIGTVIFVTDIMFSGIVGWNFKTGESSSIRTYATIGYGNGAAFAIIAMASYTAAHLGLGFEWKPAHWFGLGLEGGVNVLTSMNNHTSDSWSSYPHARLTVMFYFL